MQIEPLTKTDQIRPDQAHSQIRDRYRRAIQSGDSKEIVTACDALLSYYRIFTEGVQGRGGKGDPKASFERYVHLFHPQEAMAVFTDIRGKALALEGATV